MEDRWSRVAGTFAGGAYCSGQMEWEDDRGPQQTRGNGPGPRTAQSRSAKAEAGPLVVSGLAGQPGCGAAGFDGPCAEAVPVTDKLRLGLNLNLLGHAG